MNYILKLKQDGFIFYSKRAVIVKKTVAVVVREEMARGKCVNAICRKKKYVRTVGSDLVRRSLLSHTK